MEQVLANIGYFLELWMIQIYLSLTWDTKFCFGRFSCFLFVWNGLVATAVNTDILPKPCIWTTYVILIIYFRQKFHKRFKECVVRFGITLTGALATEFVAGLVGFFLQSYIAEDVIMLVTINLISVCIAGVIWLLVKGRKSIKQADVNYGKFFGATIISLMIFVLIVIDYYINHTIQVVYDMMIATVMSVMYWYFNKIQKTEHKLKQQKDAEDIRKVYGKAYDESMKDIRRRQHAFQNQLTAIYGTHHIAASLEELVEIQKEYCMHLQEDSRYDGILLKCNESVIAGFLYYKCVACGELGISVDYDLAVDKLKCRVLLHELIEILGILLDNACEKELENIKSELHNTQQSNSIELRLHEDDTGIELSVGNESEYITKEEIEHMFFDGYSTKGDERGIGLARVREITQKYGIEIQVMNEKRETNWIVFTIYISKETRTTE